MKSSPRSLQLEKARAHQRRPNAAKKINKRKKERKKERGKGRKKERKRGRKEGRKEGKKEGRKEERKRKKESSNEGRDFCQFYSLLYPQHLAECMTQNRCSVRI